MIKNNLSKIMGEKRIKMTELCRMTGLSKNTVHRLYHELTVNFNINTIDKLCQVLDCNTQDLFEFKRDKS